MDEKLTIWRPERERNAVKKRKRLEVRKFVRQNPEVIYKFLLLVCALLLLIEPMVIRHTTEVKLREGFKKELSAERFRVEQETLARVREEYGINDAAEEAKEMEEEAKIVAKVLYAMQHNRVEGLHLACWAVFNRVDNLRYADDVHAVASADKAFMGWSEDNQVLTDLYSIALEEVQRWHTEVRPMDNAYVYLYWSPNEIYLFDDNGHKFFESDWQKFMDRIGG